MGGGAYVDGHYYEEFDNFYPSVFVTLSPYCGQVLYWECSEHYFQASKADNERDFLMINKEKNMDKMYLLGRRIRLRKDWEKVKICVMSQANTHKYTQNEKLLSLLLQTNGPITFYNPGSTGIVGWPWWNSKILEEIRRENK